MGFTFVSEDRLSGYASGVPVDWGLQWLEYATLFPDVEPLGIQETPVIEALLDDVQLAVKPDVNAAVAAFDDCLGLSLIAGSLSRMGYVAVATWLGCEVLAAFGGGPAALIEVLGGSFVTVYYRRKLIGRMETSDYRSWLATLRPRARRHVRART